MVRKLTRPGPQKPALNPKVLAVCLALTLVGGLFVAMFGGGSFLTGAGALRLNGCGASTWRNPVTGRTEAVGRVRLDADGQPVCR